MKKLILLLSLTLIAAAVSAGDYQELNWGDSKEQVRKLYPETDKKCDTACGWLNPDSASPLIGRIFSFQEGKLFQIIALYRFEAVVDSGDEDYFLKTIEETYGVTFSADFEIDNKTISYSHIIVTASKYASNERTFIKYQRRVENKNRDTTKTVQVIYFDHAYLNKKTEEAVRKAREEKENRRKKLSM